MSTSRSMWRLLEPVHAVLYYAGEVSDEASNLGFSVTDRWPSYFPLRAAPLGAVGPGPVSSTFYSFSPAMVREHVTGAWEVADPAAVLDARARGVLASLTALLGDDVVASDDVRQAADLAVRAAEAVDVGARPLAAANLDQPPPDEPALRLWWAATVLREHRGDGHVCALVEAGLDPVESLVQMASDSDVDAERFESRGWAPSQWDAAAERLEERGWTSGRRATAEGHARRDALERRTDDLAAGPWRALGADAVGRLASLVSPWTRRIAQSGLLPSGGTLAMTRPVEDGLASRA